MAAFISKDTIIKSWNLKECVNIGPNIYREKFGSTIKLVSDSFKKPYKILQYRLHLPGFMGALSLARSWFSWFLPLWANTKTTWWLFSLGFASDNAVLTSSKISFRSMLPGLLCRSICRMPVLTFWKHQIINYVWEFCMKPTKNWIVFLFFILKLQTYQIEGWISEIFNLS